MQTNTLQTRESLSRLLEAAFPGPLNSARREQILANFDEAAAAQEPATQDPLVITLLGRCTVQNQQKMIDERTWRSQKAMLLFAFLATRAARPVADSVVAGTFWADSDEGHARSSLRGALYQVRSVLAPLMGGQDPVERSRSCRTLSFTAPCVLDTVLFEAGLQEAAELYARQRFAEAISKLNQALALYRGEFLEGFLDEWILTLRAHYAELHLQGLHLLARCLLAQGQASRAEQVARAALAVDNLREVLHKDLIEALTAQDRRGEALRHYREAAHLFQTEMGLVPSSLHEIYDTFLAEASQLAVLHRRQGALALVS